MKWQPALFAVVILLSAGIAAPQELEYVGSALWSGANDIEVVGRYAYCAYENGIAAFDISDSTAPVFTHKLFFPGKGLKIAINGNYAFLADGPGGMQIIDVSDPHNLAAVGSYVASGGFAHDIAVAANYTYLAYDSLGLQIVDITDPTRPACVGGCLMPDTNLALAIHVKGQVAYVCDSDNYFNYYSSLNYFRTVDVTNPYQPLVMGSVMVQGGGGDIWIDGSFAYRVGVEQDFGNGNFTIFDVSEPSTPSQVFSTMLAGNAFDIVTSGDYAYIATSWGISIFHVADPAHPQSMHGFIRGNDGKGVFVRNQTAFLSGLAGFLVVGVTNPDSLTVIGAYESPIRIDNVAVSGNYAFITNAANLSHLCIFDIADPSNAIEVSDIEWPHMLLSIEKAGNYVYLGTYDHGMQIVDVSSPEFPIIRGTFQVYGRIFDLFLQDHYAYIANFDWGLHIVDITDAANPVLVGQYYTGPNTSMSIFVAGDLAYIAGNSAGGNSALKIINVGNPNAPALVSEMQLPANLYDIVVAGGYAFVSGSPNYFGVVDISNPYSPSLLSTYQTEEIAFGLCVEGSYVYVADGYYGLKILDISDPFNPTLATSYFLPGIARRVQVSENLCYVADGCSMVILTALPTAADDSSPLPSPFSLSQNYPNPFNSSTTISYSLEKAGRVSIDFYNITGQRVGRLEQGIKPAGEHKALWDAAGLPSGVYFARLAAGERTETVKMVLLK